MSVAIKAGLREGSEVSGKMVLVVSEVVTVRGVAGTVEPSAGEKRALGAEGSGVGGTAGTGAGVTGGRESKENRSACGAGGGGAGAGAGADKEGLRKEGGTRSAGNEGGSGIPARARRIRCMATANSSRE